MKQTAGIALLSILIVGTSYSLQGAVRSKPDVAELIRRLESTPWSGPSPRGVPLSWDFRFTESMRQIIGVGPAAQDALIAALDNRETLDQVIILLGAVGDERAVPHIIKAMVPKKDYQKVGDAIHINLCANLALTNITVADVIWHHGGGIPSSGPEDPKQAWVAWLQKNGKSFTVKGITTSRRYSNYPNYGIYRVE